MNLKLELEYIVVKLDELSIIDEVVAQHYAGALGVIQRSLDFLTIEITNLRESIEAPQGKEKE